MYVEFLHVVYAIGLCFLLGLIVGFIAVLITQKNRLTKSRKPKFFTKPADPLPRTNPYEQDQGKEQFANQNYH